MLDTEYTGTPATVLEIYRTALGPHGANSWQLRKFVESVIRGVRSRDYVSEMLAIYYLACGPRFRYTHDPLQVELVKSPEKMVYEIKQNGVTLGDCDDLACWIISALSVAGIPGRLGTGAFDFKPELASQLGMERPERLGFALQGLGRAQGPFTHVWSEGMRPDGAWVILDPVAGPDATQMRRRLRQVRYYKMA
jgi:transglutaminase superfamily protein